MKIPPSLLTLAAVVVILFLVMRKRSLKPTVVENFLSPRECDAVIHRARQIGLHPSTVTHRVHNNRKDSSRTSSNVFLHRDEPLGLKIKQKVSKYTGVDIRRMEDVQVVHYLPGQEYKPHFDACNDFCNGGKNLPRTQTMYIYLNDVEEGGCTSFPNVGVSVEPKKGRAVCWYNTDKEMKILPESLHAADPVLRGEKWGCNVWIR